MVRMVRLYLNRVMYQTYPDLKYGTGWHICPYGNVHMVPIGPGTIGSGTDAGTYGPMAPNGLW